MNLKNPDKVRQDETLSLRINEALRKRLDNFRDLMSLKKGEKVSTSEVAKHLLESARPDGMEVADLIKTPTETLIRMRKKLDRSIPLLRAELSAFTYFVQQGAEGFPDNPISVGSCKNLLEAFRDLYELRNGTSEREHYYLGNLPGHLQPSTRNGRSDAEVLLETIAATLRELERPFTQLRPTFASRNLNVLLDDENLPGAEALNKALRPYFPALWMLAARGHYRLTQKPIREEQPEHLFLRYPSLPMVHEGEFSLDFARYKTHEFHILLSFPGHGQQRIMYPMGGYPIIREFLSMLAALDPNEEPLEEPWHWDGVHFYGYVVDEEDKKVFWFRAKGNGITFGFPEEEWSMIRELFRKGWESLEVGAAWEILQSEYGEL